MATVHGQRLSGSAARNAPTTTSAWRLEAPVVSSPTHLAEDKNDKFLDTEPLLVVGNSERIVVFFEEEQLPANHHSTES